MLPKDASTGTSYYEKLNNAAPSIASEEWAFFHLLDGISDAIAAYMSRIGVNKAELARRMNAKPSLVSRLLSGDNNPSLKTLSRVFFCLDAKLEFRLVPAKEDVEELTIEEKKPAIKYNSNFVYNGKFTNDSKEIFETIAA
jgi:transcriptional regulator with XRE-family HTH domain